jgi:hypothetical protein
MDVRKHEVYSGKVIFMDDNPHEVFTVKDGIVTSIEVEK